MRRDGRKEPAEIAGVVGDQDKIAIPRIGGDAPILPAGLADMGDMFGRISGVTGNRTQIEAETFIDQEPHPAAIVVGFRREVRAGA
jgi:hypothetical protein